MLAILIFLFREAIHGYLIVIGHRCFSKCVTIGPYCYLGCKF